MIRPYYPAGLIAMIGHYESQINGILHRVGWRQSAGMPHSDDTLSETNDELYKLITEKKNLLDILERWEREAENEYEY